MRAISTFLQNGFLFSQDIEFILVYWVLDSFLHLQEKAFPTNHTLIIMMENTNDCTPLMFFFMLVNVSGLLIVFAQSTQISWYKCDEDVK